MFSNKFSFLSLAFRPLFFFLRFFFIGGPPPCRCGGGDGGRRRPAADGLLGEDLLLALCFDLAGGSGGVLGLLEFDTPDLLLLLGGDDAAEAADELLEEIVSSIPDKLGVPSDSFRMVTLKFSNDFFRLPPFFGLSSTISSSSSSSSYSSSEE